MAAFVLKMRVLSFGRVNFKTQLCLFPEASQLLGAGWGVGRGRGESGSRLVSLTFS